MGGSWRSALLRAVYPVGIGVLTWITIGLEVTILMLSMVNQLTLPVKALLPLLLRLLLQLASAAATDDDGGCPFCAVEWKAATQTNAVLSLCLS